MYSTTKIQLRTTSILNIPLNSYGEFCFVVNGKKFQTSRIISDLLSQKISQIHASDPTFDEFTINTKNEGDFSNILKLLNFEPNIIPENEVPFISEIFETLENDCIIFDKRSSKITQENVIELIEKHQKYPIFYSKSLFDEINFVSLNFFRILTSKEEELKKLDLDILERIVNNPRIVLKDEDQLLDFVNNLYSCDSKYSSLYEYVLFQNVEMSAMNEFLNIYDVCDMTSQTWKAVSIRLKQKINKIPTKSKLHARRYKII